MAGDNIELKVVVRGLPFEATAQDVVAHFGIRESQLNLPVWSDSGRCKGVGFITCDDMAQKEQVERFDGTQFTASENTRELSIRDYEERPPRRGAQRGGGSKRRGRGGRGGGTRGTGPGAQSYTSNEETEREIYVSNASFDTTKDGFIEFFKDCGVVEEVTIPTLYSTGKPKGFAFVRFETVDARNKALDKNGMTLDNRSLGIRENKGRAQRAERSIEKRSTGLSSKPPGCTTIYVGNLPWSTDEQDLAGYFEDCGEIKSKRIVRQSWTKRSRGFGYVEFVEEASVDTAVQKQLTVDGRDLRLDYAENLNVNA